MRRGILKGLKKNSIYLYTILSCFWIVALVFIELSNAGSAQRGSAPLAADTAEKDAHEPGCVDIDGIEICD